MDARQNEDGRPTLDYSPYDDYDNPGDYSQRFSLHYAAGHNPYLNDTHGTNLDILYRIQQFMELLVFVDER